MTSSRRRAHLFIPRAVVSGGMLSQCRQLPVTDAAWGIHSITRKPNDTSFRWLCGNGFNHEMAPRVQRLSSVLVSRVVVVAGSHIPITMIQDAFKQFAFDASPAHVGGSSSS